MSSEEKVAKGSIRLPARDARSHKGDFGRTLLVGGSRGMSGAIALAGKATLRSGAGLVTLAVPQSIQDVVAGFEPSYMTIGLADNGQQIAAAAVDTIVEAAEGKTALAIGPGLGRGAGIIVAAVALYRNATQPMVVDADGLFALAQSPENFSTPAGPRILTPHPGEYSIIVDDDELSRLAIGSDQDRTTAAKNLAQCDTTGQTIVLLKGHRTVITDGQRVAINTTGNPGMATGGMGDVLTGIITGLLCQGLSPFDAARLGAHVHGQAGDLAADAMGQVPLIASDLLDYLPRVRWVESG